MLSLHRSMTWNDPGPKISGNIAEDIPFMLLALFQRIREFSPLDRGISQSTSSTTQIRPLWPYLCFKVLT